MPRYRTKKADPELEDPHGLNDRQRLFVEEYLVEPNGTQAAIKAGYGTGASVHASRLLANANIQQAIADGRKARMDRLKASQDEVLVTLAHILRANLRRAVGKKGEVLELHEMPEELTQAIASLEVKELWDGTGNVQLGVIKKVKLWEKTKAAELLLKNMGALKEKREHSVEDSFTDLILRSMKPKEGE